MTREEEIIARAEEAEKETTFSDIVLKAKGVCSAYGIGFLEGAKWADEHPENEEPKNKDFKDFVNSYMRANDDNILHYYDRYAGLVDGAQWQKEQMMFTRPLTPLRETVEVTTRLPHVDDDLKPIAEFIMDYCLWDLRKDEWNQPVIVVPLFRVLDALIQRGKPYCEGE